MQKELEIKGQPPSGIRESNTEIWNEIILKHSKIYKVKPQ